MEAVIDPTNAGALDQWKNVVEEHRRTKLLELAANTPSMHPRYPHMTTDGLILELWSKGVEIPEVLTFGSPYDDVMRSWCRQGEQDLLGFIYDHRENLYTALMDFATMFRGLPMGSLGILEWYIDPKYPSLMSELNQVWIQLPLSRGEPLTQAQELFDKLPRDLDLVYLFLSLLPSLSQIINHSKRQIVEKLLFGEYMRLVKQILV
jgi:hypothetical protein